MPFPMPGDDAPKTPEDLTPFPLSMMLTEGVEFWWRVRSFSADYTNIPMWGNGSVVLEQIDTEDDQSEKSRVRPANCLWSQTLTDGEDSLIITVGFLPPIATPLPFRVDNFEGPCYYVQPSTSTSTATVVPAMWITLYYTAFFNDESGQLSTVEIPDANGSVNWNFCGRAMQASRFITTADIGLTVEKHSYWSYGGTWNETTGEKILTT
jgi:hypothetical protein